MRAFLMRQGRQFAAMFRPPFPGLWFALLLYYVWCFFVYPHSQTLRADLPDSDDYMYLAQVLDWLKGQSWFSNIQHRLDPPPFGIGGDPVPFSRLPQIPLAALTILFKWMGLPPRGAATVAALIWPPVMLGFLFAATKEVAAQFVPRAWAGASAYVLLFANATTFLFMPGHVDHHGLDILLTALALGGVFRMMREPKDRRWAVLAGFLLALDLAVALEILPWLIVIASAVALWAIAEGGAAARSALAFGLALFLSCAFFLAIAVPPAAFFQPDLLVYSIVYVLFAGSIAFVLAGIAIVADDRPAWRWAVGIGLAAASALLFFNRFPALLAGPFGGVNTKLANLMLNGLGESEALIKTGHSWLWLFARVLNGFLALGYALYALRRAGKGERWPLGLLTVLLAASVALTLFYQFRFIAIMGFFAAVVLTILLQRGWKHIGAKTRGRRKVWAEIGLVLLVGPFTTVLVPALADGRSLNAGVLLFPVYGTDFDRNCDMFGLEQALDSPPLYAGKPRLIMNPMDIGPELLFRTKDAVLAAPYHTDIAGNIDAMRFFATTDPAEARAVARRRHVDLVVSCFMIPRIYAGIGPDGRPMNFGKGIVAAPAGPLHGKPRPRFLQLLMENRPPFWLKRVWIKAAPNYVVYEVKLHGRKTAGPKPPLRTPAGPE